MICGNETREATSNIMSNVEDLRYGRLQREDNGGSVCREIFGILYSRESNGTLHPGN